MDKKIRKGLKGPYCNVVTRFFNFFMPDDPLHPLTKTLQPFATADIRNSYAESVSKGMRTAGYNCQTGETAMSGVYHPLISIELFGEGYKANDHK